MVTIKNITRKNVISPKAKVASSFMDRMLGLLNPHNPRFLIINTHFGIHTFFMKYPIDVILLNNNSKVVALQKKLQPFKFFFYNPRFSQIIEMPQGSIEKCCIEINDKILFE